MTQAVRPRRNRLRTQTAVRDDQSFGDGRGLLSIQIDVEKAGVLLIVRADHRWKCPFIEVKQSR
jgi:hypothetical protein